MALTHGGSSRGFGACWSMRSITASARAPPTVLGPFYVGEHKVMPHGTDVSANLPGERMFVQSRVTDLAGKPRFLFEGVACRMAERTLAIGHCVKSPRDSQRHIAKDPPKTTRVCICSIIVRRTKIERIA